MKNILFRLFIIVLFTVMFSFTACDDSGGAGSSSSGGGGSTGNDITITVSAIPGITVPVRDAVPVTTAIDTDQYTGSISWSPDDSPFAAETVYTVTIVLTAKTGYTMTGVAENFFTVTGAETVANPAGSGVVTAVFPATGSLSDIDVVFESVTQTGGSSGTTDSTGLILEFDIDPTTLTADNISLTGATKGTLTGTGTTRNLEISDITVANGETVSVAITSSEGYAITGSPQTAVVYKSSEIVTIDEIPDIVVPERDAVPVTTAIDTDQYTGSISWSPDDSPFAAETVYTASIVLTAKTGYTMTGVAENFFTVTGAETVTNPADSGVVIAVFPATGAIPDVNVTFESVTQTGGISDTTDSTGLILEFDIDPTTLTADNISLTGATKGTLTGTGTTRNLEISDITVANGETVSVAITSPEGYAITGSPQTAVVYRDFYYIGKVYGGGVIAYILQSDDPGYVEGEIHGLIATSEDLGEDVIWALSDYQELAVPGGTSTDFGAGYGNTYRIYNQNGVGSSYAARLAWDCVDGGYTDWYLPSLDELNKLYTNKDAIGGFTNDSYWSSSEDADYPSGPWAGAWGQSFLTGYQNVFSKYWYTNMWVRAVRSF